MKINKGFLINKLSIITITFIKIKKNFNEGKHGKLIKVIEK
jgi:hypothetical protein